MISIFKLPQPTTEITETSSLILVFLVFADNLNSIFRGIIAVASSAKIAVASSACVLFFALLCSYTLIFVLKCRFKWFKNLKFDDTTVLHLVGLFLYMYGNNVSFIVELLADDLRCDEECDKIVNTSGTFTLGIALIMFILPRMQSRNERSDETSCTPYDLALNKIAAIAILDAVYTTTTSLTTKECTTLNIAATSVFLTLCCVGGVYHVIKQGIKCRKVTGHYCKAVFSTILASLSLSVYLLMDNSLPLDCAFEHNISDTGDEYEIANSTTGTDFYNHSFTSALLRLICMSVTFSFNIIILLMAYCHKHDIEPY